MFQPETSREVTGRIRNLHSQIALAVGSAGLLMSHAGESWNNTRQGSAWGEGMFERTPKRFTMSRETSRRGFIFTKDCISEGLFMACCQVDLSSVPTHAENYPPTLRGVHARIYKCILELWVYVSHLPSDLPTTPLHSTPPYSPQIFLSAFRFIGTQR